MTPRPPREHAAEESPQQVDAQRATIERILASLKHLKFGTVTIVVQDGIVVQIERTEKVRLR